ncbi:hypothetical protein [Pseudophaeobacter sp. C1-32P7]|uniref:hypothetical protein n=1 Tax=Pseudophaeobacter sp. C1-32P7 TaxID=3098142 RepID=UPI0034D3BD62
MTGEQRLWQTVLMLALADATSVSQTMTAIRQRDAADSWIRDCRKDFRKICTLAGFDPAVVHDAYINGRIDGSQLVYHREPRQQPGAAQEGAPVGTILYRGASYRNASELARKLCCNRGAIYKALTRGTFFGHPICRVESGQGGSQS